MSSIQPCLMSKYLLVQGKLIWMMLERFAAREKETVLTCEWGENAWRWSSYACCNHRWVHGLGAERAACEGPQQSHAKGKNSDNSKDLLSTGYWEGLGKKDLVESINPHPSPTVHWQVNTGVPFPKILFSGSVEILHSPQCSWRSSLI